MPFVAVLSILRSIFNAVCTCVPQWGGGAVPAVVVGPDYPQVHEVKPESEEQKTSCKIFSTSICKILSVTFIDY